MDGVVSILALLGLFFGFNSFFSPHLPWGGSTIRCFGALNILLELGVSASFFYRTLYSSLNFSYLILLLAVIILGEIDTYPVISTSEPIPPPNSRSFTIRGSPLRRGTRGSPRPFPSDD